MGSIAAVPLVQRGSIGLSPGSIAAVPLVSRFKGSKTDIIYIAGP